MTAAIAVIAVQDAADVVADVAQVAAQAVVAAATLRLPRDAGPSTPES